MAWKQIGAAARQYSLQHRGLATILTRLPPHGWQQTEAEDKAAAASSQLPPPPCCSGPCTSDRLPMVASHCLASAGIPELVLLLQQQDRAVFLVSGGFHAIIDPIAEHLGLPASHVFANTILYKVCRP